MKPLNSNRRNYIQKCTGSFTLLITLLITLVFASSASAGNIGFTFELQGTQCVIANRGDRAAYYPVIFKLERDGSWLPLSAANQPAELLPGGILRGNLGDIPGKISSDILSLCPVMVRFFDQAGVSFGQVTVLRTPLAGATITAGYLHKRLRLAAPQEKGKISATWVLAPLEEGIKPILRPHPFEHHQPSASRIEWSGRSSVELFTGAALPSAILIHETPLGLSLQRVHYSGVKKKEQRTGWLKRPKKMYSLALISVAWGTLLLILRRWWGGAHA